MIQSKDIKEEDWLFNSINAPVLVEGLKKRLSQKDTISWCLSEVAKDFGIEFFVIDDVTYLPIVTFNRNGFIYRYRLYVTKNGIGVNAL